MAFSMSKEKLTLQVAPVRQQKPQPVAVLALDVDLPEPPGAHDMRDALGVGPVGLVAHRRHRSACVIGLEAYHRHASLQQLDL